MAGKKIKYEKIMIDGVKYNLYHIEYKGKVHKVASYALHHKVETMLEKDGFNSLANHIDSLYDVYIPKGVKKLGEDEIIKSAIDGIENIS